MPRKDELLEEMKSRGQSVAEVRRNDIRRKREMKLNKMKYMNNYGKSMFEGKSGATRGNPKFESLKQKYQSIVEEVNKKLSAKKKEKVVTSEEERFDLETKPEKKESIAKMKEDINVFQNNLRETEKNEREIKLEEGDNKKKKKKRDREKGRRRKKTQDDMNILNNNNPMHINFLDDFQQDLEENKKDSSSDEGRRSIKSETSGEFH